jgi:Holliday junction resolvasome RuvABC endonuclease subunit
MNSFVGLDMSVTHSGVAVKTGTKIKLEAIKTKVGQFETNLDRYDHIVKETMKLIPKGTKLVCVEDFFIPNTSSRFASAIQLIALGTLMRKALNDMGLYFIIVSPKQGKKFVTGTGAASKEFVIREASKWSSDIGKDDNKADALGFAILAETVWKLKNGSKISGLSEKQIEVAQDVYDYRPCFNMKK